jgi:hypothetical protein
LAQERNKKDNFLKFSKQTQLETWHHKAYGI